MLSFSSRISIRGLISVMIGLIGLAVLALGATIWSLRQDATEGALRESDHIATILADQTERSAAAVDALLTKIAARVDDLHVEKPDDFSRLVHTQETYRYLMDRLSRPPLVNV